MRARFIGIGLTDVLFALAELRWKEVMFNWRCTEPSLDELFGDAAMRLLMQRDGVTESDIRALLCTLKDARAVALVATKREPRLYQRRSPYARSKRRGREQPGSKIIESR
jgi:hypothetical protein